MPIKTVATYANLADFERVGVQIAKQMGHFETLMQEASVAALIHLEKHGNYNILKPLWQAAQAWRSASMSNKWKAWIVAHSFLVYNAKNLRGAALRDAEYGSLWSKDKNRKMDIEGARKHPWFDQELIRQSSTKPVNLDAQVARFIKSMQALIDAGKVVTGKGKEQHRATINEVRGTIRSMMESLTAPKPKIVSTKATAKKVEPKAVKSTMKGQPRVARQPTQARKAA